MIIYCCLQQFCSRSRVFFFSQLLFRLRINREMQLWLLKRLGDGTIRSGRGTAKSIFMNDPSFAVYIFFLSLSQRIAQQSSRDTRLSISITARFRKFFGYLPPSSRILLDGIFEWSARKARCKSKLHDPWEFTSAPELNCVCHWSIDIPGHGFSDELFTVSPLVKCR